MKKNFKSVLIALLSVLMIGLIGCGNDKTTTENSNSQTNTPTTKEEYAKYLDERYNYYLGDSKLTTDYNVYADDFKYTGSNEEFVTAYGDAYGTLKTQLLSLKSDLETNVQKGTDEVDELNQNVITSIDKTVASIDDFDENYKTNVKDYGTLTNDDMIKGFQSIGRAPYDARTELDKLVKDAKNTLNIKH